MVILAAIVILSFTLVALQVDDWSRDFSENQATTSETHFDPQLRPVEVSFSLDETEALVRKVVRRLNRWEWIETEESVDKRVLILTRTSAIMRFVDDLKVTLTQLEGDRVLIEMESQSRVGKGDLGQNPRNIRKLLSEIRLLVD